MRIHRYWATADFETQGGAVGTLRRGSDVSQADAQQRADDAARAYANSGTDYLDWYEYHAANKPEAIVDEVLDERGVRAGAVTIGVSGCLVLNTATLVFVDVDDAPAQTKSDGGLLGRLFGKKAPPAPSPIERSLEALHGWIGEDASRGARVYRTSAGLRYLLTSPAMEPSAPETAALLDRLHADPLYRRLCTAQGCYRARLTPKPWRVPGAPRTRIGPPDERGDPPASYHAFKDAYDHACDGYATCALEEQLGDQTPRSPSDGLLIRMHDEMTRAESGDPLA